MSTSKRSVLRRMLQTRSGLVLVNAMFSWRSDYSTDTARYVRGKQNVTYYALLTATRRRLAVWKQADFPFRSTVDRSRAPRVDPPRLSERCSLGQSSSPISSFESVSSPVLRGGRVAQAFRYISLGRTLGRSVDPGPGPQDGGACTRSALLMAKTTVL